MKTSFGKVSLPQLAESRIAVCLASSLPQLARLGRKAWALITGGSLCIRGPAVAWIASEDGRCMCLFEASSAEDVKRLNDEAKLPYSRVVKALDITP
jgi:Protein of unknown function (DUF4242)